jgi:hypothetical protein
MGFFRKAEQCFLLLFLEKEEYIRLIISLGARPQTPWGSASRRSGLSVHEQHFLFLFPEKKKTIGRIGPRWGKV